MCCLTAHCRVAEVRMVEHVESFEAQLEAHAFRTMNSRLRAVSRFTAFGPTRDWFPALPKVPIGLGTNPAGVSHCSVLRLRTYGLPATFGRSNPILVKELSTPVNGVNQVPERAVRIARNFQVPTNLSARRLLRRGDSATADRLNAWRTSNPQLPCSPFRLSGFCVCGPPMSPMKSTSLMQCEYV